MSKIDLRAEFANDFHRRLRAAITASGLSDRQVSVAARGPKYPTTVSSIFSQKSVPRADVIQALALILNVSTDYLLGTAPALTLSSSADAPAFPRTSEAITLASGVARNSTLPAAFPTIDTMLAWWRATGKRLTNIDQISRHFDLFSEPDDKQIKEYALGYDSLMSRTMRALDLTAFEQFFDLVPDPKLAQIAEWHIQAIRGEVVLIPEYLTIKLATGRTVVREYDRLLLPITGPEGNNLVLSYCRPCAPNRPLIE